MTIELKVILPIALGALGIGIAVWQFFKNQQLQKKSLALETENQGLQKKNLAWAAKNEEQHQKTQARQHELEQQNQKLQQQILDSQQEKDTPGGWVPPLGESLPEQPVSFSVKSSMDILSTLAVAMMKENRRELDFAEIQTLLPEAMAGQSLVNFLNEMVLNARLLHLSAGKYSFMHLTFQEYLAAWFYAKSENQNDILEHRDKDYWTETFKLFANMADIELFFNEIIESLVEKKYWMQMQLWNECLEDIVKPDVKKELELKFAQKVLSILPELENLEENEPLLMQLYTNYSMYFHAPLFVDQGWQLFYRAKHPFLQSVGSSILNRASKESQDALITEIKGRLDTFETLADINPAQMLDFLFQNNNSIALLIEARKNLLDFVYVLTRLRAVNLFLVYVVLRSFRDFQYLCDLINWRALDVLRFLVHPSNLGDFRDLQYLRIARDQFLEKNETLIRQHKPAIDLWVDNAIEKLQASSDEELVNRFPHTTMAEIQHFKNQKNVTPPSFLKELEADAMAFFKSATVTGPWLEETAGVVEPLLGAGGFEDILIKVCADSSPKLKAKRPVILRYLLDQDKLTLDKPTVLALLNFQLDPDNRENQATELEAFALLQKKGPKKLKKFLNEITARPPRNISSLNSVYISGSLD